MTKESKEGRINDKERKVLEFLAPEWNDEMNCYYFRGIAADINLPIKVVRRACRSLARKGLVEYVRGLFNNDGEVAGSGYCATRKGALLVNACIVCRQEVANMTDGTCQWCFKKNEESKTL